MTYFVYNKIFDSFHRQDTLTGKLVNRKFVDIGPSYNNCPPPYVYASDSWEDFRRTLVHRGVLHVPARDRIEYLMPK